MWQRHCWGFSSEHKVFCWLPNGLRLQGLSPPCPLYLCDFCQCAVRFKYGSSVSRSVCQWCCRARGRMASLCIGIILHTHVSSQSPSAHGRSNSQQPSSGWFELTSNRAPNTPHEVNIEIWDLCHMCAVRAPVFYGYSALTFSISKGRGGEESFTRVS